MTYSVVFIDWISYTRSNDDKKLEYPSTFASLSREIVTEWNRFNGRGIGAQENVVHVKPNKPFSDARMDVNTRSRIEWGGPGARALISFSGEGCRFLRTMGLTQTVLASVAFDVSRIDLSVDIRCDTSPYDFAGQRDKKRHKTGSKWYSDEGETQYVGSWASDRFARVYRYNPPHERAEFLRVEHVFKGRHAKALAAKLVTTSPHAVLASCGTIYGWTHPNWLVAKSDAGTPEEVVWYKEERHVSKTLRWLNETAAPAIIRMVHEGEIGDAQEWFNHLVLNQMYDNGRDDPSGSHKLGG